APGAGAAPPGPSAAADEAREAQLDVSVGPLEDDPHDLGGRGVPARRIQLLEGADLDLGIDGVAAAALGHGHDGHGHPRHSPRHRPRIPPSQTTSRERLFSSSTFRAAPYSSRGTGSRKEPERPRGTRMSTISGLSTNIIRAILP